jgi:Bacterial SH3 domain
VPRTALSLLLSALCVLACSKQEPVATETTDTRESIQTAYVGAPELKAHEKPDDASRVVTTFLNGESISILSRKGDWVEVRTASGNAWARASDLTTAEAAKAEEENPTAKFRLAPSPISSPGIKGTIYIEAAVNTDGDVTSTKLMTNTTGSDSLAARNAEALMHVKFYPIVRRGQKKAFLYDYRVDY